MNWTKPATLKGIIRFILFLLVIGCVQRSALAQQGNNPFELTPRLDAVGTPTEVATVTPTSSNPFDLVAPTKETTAASSNKAVRPAKPKKAIKPESAYKRFLFISLMITLLLLTLLMTFLRPFFQKVYSAFGSDNMFNQVFRERESIGLTPFLFLYILFFLNAGLFTYLMLNHYKISVASTHLLGWLYCILGVAAVFLIKHLVISLIGVVFPVQKETRSYNFLIIIFSIIISLILVPVNVLLAYGPASIALYLLYFAWGTLGIVYLFRYLRGVAIANRFLAFHKFHFLLYLCAVEIAPLAVIVKLLMNYEAG
ncbi:MAG: DUF4271 domain-containing protein [Saprospiraceae bacterium]